MANFELADISGKLVDYTKKRTPALPKIKEKKQFFYYANKFPFTDKPAGLPVFVFESSQLDKAIIGKIKEKSKDKLASGTVYRNGDDVLVFNVKTGALKDFNMHEFQIGEAIKTDTQVGGNAIDIDESKQKNFADLYARQERKLAKAKADAAELNTRYADAMKSYTKAAAAVKADGKDQLLKDARSEAATAKTEANKAKAANDKLVAFLEAVIGKIKAANTDEKKAQILFSEGKFDDGIKQLEGLAYKSMMATDEAIMVLGRTEDTWKLQLSQEAQGRVLAVDSDKYSLPANDAFMKSGLDIKAQFQLVTDFTDATKRVMKMASLTRSKFDTYIENVKEKEPALWSKSGNCPAVSAREIGQLIDDGYWYAEHPDPKNKGKTIQMMFPRSASKSLQEELAEAVAKRNRG